MRSRQSKRAHPPAILRQFPLRVSGHHGVNPLAYLTDVLGRIGSHPQNRLDELLPHLWRPPDQPAKPPSPA
ncbi:MAG: transposase domain-containing protein [Polyangia bacterium]